jgi:transcriptional regulator with XRE-family HTH domain
MDMSHPVDIHVGQRLKQLRILRGMTQTDVADGLNISFQQVQKYELGRNRISASKLFELSHILKVAPSYFFDGLDAGNTAPQVLDEEATKIASMLTRIKDDRLRGQIRSFITEIANSQPPESRGNAA